MHGYSWIDRITHNLAMRQIEMQTLLSNFEDRAFNKSGTDISAANPVFITSLPRAGTTLLLEVIARTATFAAHTYRDMPFLLCPLTWDKISRRFRRHDLARPRAQGDGMVVSFDSVEAFEEIIWRAFWPEHFEENRIRPWLAGKTDEQAEFVTFFRQHMRKVVALKQRRTQRPEAQRYISKNNTNIARVAWMLRHFPDATILIPYRDPAAHISSLARQHANFLRLQDDDPFVLQYMTSIGHFDFGRGLRPIDFDEWTAHNSGLRPESFDFWAEYWIAAFRAILVSVQKNVVLFSYDRLCAAPDHGLSALEARMGLPLGDLAFAAARIRPQTRYNDFAELTRDRRHRLQDTLERLDEAALF